MSLLIVLFLTSCHSLKRETASVDPEIIPVQETPAVIEEIPVVIESEPVIEQAEESVEEVPVIVPFVVTDEQEPIQTEENAPEPLQNVTEPPETEVKGVTTSDEENVPEPILVVPVEEETEPEVEEKTVIEKISDTMSGKDGPKDAVIGGNVLPMWFVYTAAFLILAILFTFCYISKQRRYASYRRDRE